MSEATDYTTFTTALAAATTIAAVETALGTFLATYSEFNDPFAKTARSLAENRKQALLTAGLTHTKTAGHPVS